MAKYEIVEDKKPFMGPSYSFGNRLRRVLWQTVYLLFFKYTPPPMHRWRTRILRIFGARVSPESYVYPSVTIWAPWNLAMERHATLGRQVTCYNPAPVYLGEQAVVSQGTHLCTASHDYNDPAFQLFAKPIRIERSAWVAAECFVGPGVTVGEGAVLGARTVLFRNAPPFTIWIGNPAVFKKERLCPDSSAKEKAR